uniref:Protein SEC13 homolog n=1 Tax=Trichuris muris TaxID=70415 RepID=A0A5S6R5I7_TRIMR
MKSAIAVRWTSRTAISNRAPTLPPSVAWEDWQRSLKIQTLSGIRSSSLCQPCCLPKMVSVLNRIETGHQDFIHDAKTDFFGTRLATCSSDRTVKIYDLKPAGQHVPIAKLADHEGPVWQLSWSHPMYGSLLASCSYDRKVIVWKETESKWSKLAELRYHEASVNSVAWSPKEFGLKLAFGSADGSISVVTFELNMESWAQSKILDAHSLGCNAVCWAPAAESGCVCDPEGQPKSIVKMLASGGCDGSVKIWRETEDGNWVEQARLQGHRDWVRDVEWNPLVISAYRIASCSQDRTVTIWTCSDIGANTWSNQVLPVFEDVVWSVSWSLCGTYLAIGYGDNQVSIWKESAENVWLCVSMDKLDRYFDKPQPICGVGSANATLTWLSGIWRTVKLTVGLGCQRALTNLHTNMVSEKPTVSEEEIVQLFDAILDRDLEAVQELCKRKELIVAEDSAGQTPLHAAAFIGDLPIAEWFIDNGAPLDKKDYRLLTPLHRACRQNNHLIAERLLGCGCDSMPTDSTWLTPLHVCAANNSLECAMLLVRVVEDPNATDKSGYTPLHYAAYFGHDKIVRLLLQNNASLDATDQRGRQPLHLAAFGGHQIVVEELLRAGANPNARDGLKYNALHCAAAGGHAPICELLLERGRGGVLLDVHSVTVDGDTPMHVAARNGRTSVVSTLLEADADIERRNGRSMTPLHCAVASSSGTTVTELLIANGASMVVKTKCGSTPLHLCAATGRTERAAMLLMNGAEPNAQDDNGDTPMHRAAKEGHDLIIKKLVHFGADVNRANNEGIRPIDFAAAHGYTSTVRTLLKFGARTNLVDNEGRSLMHYAAVSSFRSDGCVKTLLGQKVSHWRADARGLTPLHYAAFAANIYTLRILILAGANVEAITLENHTPLHYAALFDSTGDCIQALVNKEANCAAQDRYGFSPLHYAASRGSLSACKTMWSKLNSSQVTSAFQQGTITPLHCAARYGWVDVMEFFIKNGCDIDTRDVYGRTALYVALYYGKYEFASAMLAHGPNVTQQTCRDLSTPLHLIASSEIGSDLLREMLNKMGSEKDVDVRDELQRTPLMFAASLSEPTSADMLLKAGAEPSLLDKHYRSALSVAVYHGRTRTVQLILESLGTDAVRYILADDTGGRNSFHQAAWSGDETILRSLLQRVPDGFVIDEMVSSKGFSPFHVAAQRGHAKVLEVLLEQQKEKFFSGGDRSPLHYAACLKSPECCLALCRFLGSHAVHLKDSQQRTPLHDGCSSGGLAVCVTLAEAGLSPNDRDQRGTTPLMEAAKRGYIEIVEMLLQKGADLSVTDKKGNTALHHAMINKEEGVALTILGYCSFVDMQNSEGRTALHYAVANVMLSAVETLLLKNASLFVLDRDELSAITMLVNDNERRYCLEMLLIAMGAQADTGYPMIKAPLGKSQGDDSAADTRTQSFLSCSSDSELY